MTLRFLRRVSFFVLATFASMTAKAADDLPVHKDVPVPALSKVNWEGPYLGGHWGYGTGLMKWHNPQGYYSSTLDVPANGHNDGLLGGAQIGYNKQYGAMVIGVEADMNAGRLLGYAPCGAIVTIGGSGDTCGNRTELMASLTGRLGYAAGRSLFYVKGGKAYSRDQTSVSNDLLLPIPPVSSSANRYGWTIGGGVAYAIDPNWSVNAEYGYYDFGKQTYALGAGVYAGSFDVAHVQQVAKFGLNYRLGGAGGDGGAALALSDNLTGEFGTRVGYSSGRFQGKYYNPLFVQQASVLTWPGQAGLAAEAFARLDHTSGLFVKGTLGGVNIGSSHMNDEDTAEAMAPLPYSNTISSTRNGRDLYGTADFGYTFLRNNSWNLGGFVGYGHYTQRLNAYGCEQIGGNPVVCTPAGSVNPSALIISETETWNALRLGLTGSVMLNRRLKLSGEAAWLPYASLSAKDNHWWRPDINPLIDKGHGSKGFQLEAMLSYTVTDRWSAGGGVRYLSLETEGTTQFPFDGLSKFVSSRFTTFIQASYHFGD